MDDLGVDAVGGPADGERLIGESLGLGVLAGGQPVARLDEQRVGEVQRHVERGGARPELGEQAEVVVDPRLLEEVRHREQRRRQLEVDVPGAAGLGHGDEHGLRALVEAVQLPERQAARELR